MNATKNASPEAQATFEGLGITPELLSVVQKAGFTTPTPIQHQVIPVATSGKDTIGIAQTGTGKTLGFGIPAVQALLEGTAQKVLILVPTRELALQVAETLKKISAPLKIGGVVLIGGEAIGKQIRALRDNPRVIIATPGRLIDHLGQGTVSLSDVGVLVLDEADHMLDIGFAPQLNEIVTYLPKERQTMLFSATMSKEISVLATRYLETPYRIEVAPAGTAAERVEQEIIVVPKSAKFALLLSILKEKEGSVLVFARMKHSAKQIAKSLRDNGEKAAEIHSNRSLAQRREALQGFKDGRYRVLVATDIAARGIDVSGISLVVNYDLPEQTEDYVHRIGRTGRAGKSGSAVSFALPDQQREVMAIERLIRKQLPLRKHAGGPIVPLSEVERTDERATHYSSRRPAPGRRVATHPTRDRSPRGGARPSRAGAPRRRPR